MPHVQPPTFSRSNLSPLERLTLLAVLAVTLATFASTFTFGWVYDDPPQIPNNPDLQWNRVGFLLTHHQWAFMPGVQARFYRPLLPLWFLVNKSLFGLNPHWFHFTTVLAHIAPVAFAFLIALRLLQEVSAALFAAAVFALHPLQVETASWISDVNDSLVAVLCFASFLAYLKAVVENKRQTLWWTLAIALFALALLAKEVAILLPAIILVHVLTSPAGDERGRFVSLRTVLIALSFALAAFGWVLLRHHIVGGLVVVTGVVPWKTVLLSAPRMLVFYLGKTVAPVGLSPHYDFQVVRSAAGVQFLASCLVLLVVAICAALAIRRWRATVAVALAWLIFPLLPALNLRWVNRADYLHDRYMYMSMLGVALLAGIGWRELKRRGPQDLILAAGLVLLSAMACASAIQSQYWANDPFLFLRATKIAPNNPWSHFNYGSALSAQGKFSEAAAHFVRSDELDPGWRASQNAGFCYQQNGDLVAANRWFERALQADPTKAETWFALGEIRLQQQRPQEAITLLKRALELSPEAAGYHYALGTALERVAHPREALEAYKTELHLHPYQKGAQHAIDRLRTENPER